MKSLNIKQEPTKVILDRFNARNSLQLDHRDFNFSAPVEVIDLTLKTDTEVTVTPKADSVGYNPFKIKYSRMDIAEVADQINVLVSSDNSDNIHDILDNINEAFGIHLLGSDLDNTTVTYDDPTDKTLRATVKLKIKDNSYLFKGEYDLVLNEKLKPYDPAVRDAITGLVVTKNNSVETIKNLNTTFDTLAYFKFLSNVEHLVTRIDRIFKLKNHFIALGEFELENIPADITEQAGNGTYKTLKVSKVGKLLAAYKNPKFDDLKSLNDIFVSSNNLEHHYVLDSNNSINQNTTGIYKYDNNGNRVDNYNSTGNLVERLLALDDGSIIVATKPVGLANSYISIKKYDATGNIDTSFTEIKLTDKFNNAFTVSDLSFSLDTNGNIDGFYVLMHEVFGQKLFPKVNDTVVYNFNDSSSLKYDYNLPILKFDLDGNLDTNFNGLKTINNFFNVTVENNPNYKTIFEFKTNTNSGLVWFIRCKNPFTSLETLLPIILYSDGSIHYPNSEEIAKLPFIKEVIKIESSQYNFIALIKSIIHDPINGFKEQYQVIVFDTKGNLNGKFFIEDVANCTDMLIF